MAVARSSSTAPSGSTSLSGTRTTAFVESKLRRRWSDFQDESEGEGTDDETESTSTGGLSLETTLVEACTTDTVCEAAIASEPSRPRLRTPLSADAPEFVPTLTMQCPLVGTFYLTAETPEMRPPPREELRRAAPPPEASEEVWQCRIMQRQKAVQAGMELEAYRWYASLSPCDKRRDLVQPMPDPMDRTLSKRRWKYLVQNWRVSIAELYAEEQECSTAMTVALSDECQSEATTETGGASPTGEDDAASLGSGSRSSRTFVFSP